ncbi:uncharacterized protein LOC114870935 [Osmia bicornis bicornis]|uniref:uncharacterized protein LOC114870935 n=1 Tax=Osmia bicornis bicornis TaxID=1437191 RepID=UPI0010F5A8C4|nr:uncharacterized protein LOC114870935 [Osmia bicornis bicornis]
MCYKKVECHGKSEKGPIFKLNAYIKKYERKFGKISSSKFLSQKQLGLLNLIHKLVEAIDKEDTDKQQALHILKSSNEAIKETIITFQNSMKLYKETMKFEFAKVDCLSTNRLLNINYAYI